MCAHEVSFKRFGFLTQAVENPAISSIGTTVDTALKNNPDRVFWLIINLSGNVVYVALSRDVSTTKGIRLDPNGGWASMSADEDGEAVAYEVFAVATAAASAIYVLEIKKAG